MAPNEISLIVNTGIQMVTFRVSLDTQETKFKEYFHEWDEKDEATGELKRKLELVHMVKSEDDGKHYYRKADLLYEGLLASGEEPPTVADIRDEGIDPLKIDDLLTEGTTGLIYSLSLGGIKDQLARFENEWLPAPYFVKPGKHTISFGPLNWSRFKLVPVTEENGKKTYDVILAFDTRASYSGSQKKCECPVFSQNAGRSLNISLCDDEMYLLEYCSPDSQWSYIDSHLMKLIHPNIQDRARIRAKDGMKMLYVASYILLMEFLAKKNLFPRVILYRDKDAVSKDVDMVVDIGNSRTTALLIEDNSNFNQVRPLALTDYTDLLDSTYERPALRTYGEPFDMRLAFRKVNFGEFGPVDSRQFVYPSLVRLGQEANALIHRASTDGNPLGSLSTYSSPKRFLWDGRPNDEEWRFLVMPNEKADPILKLEGITSRLDSYGKVTTSGGSTHNYSRRSLMTLCFLEMLVQAFTQINDCRHRSVTEGLGAPDMPRKIRRMIVTCPTAMSRLEREALIGCARDAVKLFVNFYRDGDVNEREIEVVPSVATRDGERQWYYDEATCAQLVYMYGEVGHKYKGCCGEFFEIYGKTQAGRRALTVGSLDIGAGTMDLMISRYTYEQGDITTITPDPLFYDSFYFAGDDMLYGLVRNVMLLGEDSAFRRSLQDLPYDVYRQKMKDFFGPDHNGQSYSDRVLRKDFNIQYSLPLMCRFLELVKGRSEDGPVRYADVFSKYPPADSVIEGFRKKTGIDVTQIEWSFSFDKVSAVIEKEFEPWLRKIATMMYAFSCDIVLLSGRPASLPVIRDIFLKYYAVSPDRLIILNDYYVGDWYPFSNNTGRIANPKTIVAMGGVIAYYASVLSNLDGFRIDLKKLNEGLKSTVHYIEASRDRLPVEYFLKEGQMSGWLTVSRIPTVLDVRQLQLDSYPSRTLYSIDFNRRRIADVIRKKPENIDRSDREIRELADRSIEKLKKRMPFKLGIERDADDTECLRITSIEDREGDDVRDSFLEIHLQSLGASEKYWLDTGIFILD